MRVTSKKRSLLDSGASVSMFGPSASNELLGVKRRRVPLEIQGVKGSLLAPYSVIHRDFGSGVLVPEYNGPSLISMASILRTHDMSTLNQKSILLNPKFDSGKTFVASKSKDRLFELRQVSSTSAFSAMTGSKYPLPGKVADVIRLHELLGHPSESVMIDALAGGEYSVFGLDKADVRNANLQDCKGCLQGKMDSRHTRSKAVRPGPVALGQHLHCDLKFINLGGKSLTYLVAVDEATRFIYHQYLRSKNKEDILHAVRGLVNFFTGKRGGVLTSYIHCDGESSVRALSADGSLMGIGAEYVPVAPGTHEKVAERNILTIRNKVRATFYGLSYTIPGFLIPDLVDFVILGINQTPNKLTKNVSPWSLLYGEGVDGRRLRFPFGTVCFAPDSRPGGAMERRSLLSIVIGRAGLSSAVNVYILGEDDSSERRRVVHKVHPISAPFDGKISAALDRLGSGDPVAIDWDTLITLETPSRLVDSPTIRPESPEGSQLQQFQGVPLPDSSPPQPSNGTMVPIQSSTSSASAAFDPVDPASFAAMDAGDQRQSSVGVLSTNGPGLNQPRLDSARPNQDVKGCDRKHHELGAGDLFRSGDAAVSTTAPSGGFVDTGDVAVFTTAPSGGPNLTNAEGVKVSEGMHGLSDHPGGKGNAASCSTGQPLSGDAEVPRESVLHALAGGAASGANKGELSPDELTAVLAELTQLDVYDVLDPVDLKSARKGTVRKAISTVMLVNKKIAPDGSFVKTKARFVVRGFLDFGDIGRTNSPTVAQETVMLGINYAVSSDYNIDIFDVRAAFLEAPLERQDVFARIDKVLAGPLLKRCPRLSCGKLPNGDVIVRLKRALYGLKDAPISWYKKLKASLKKLGFKRSRMDHCLFYKHTKKGPHMVLVHVDDILSTGPSKSMDEFRRGLKECFKEVTEQINPEKFNYLGLSCERNRTRRTIALRQTKYIDSVLEKLGGENLERSTAAPAGKDLFLVHRDSPALDFVKAKIFHSVVMSLLYITKTRLDIKCAVSFLTTRTQSPNYADWHKMLKVVRYLRGTRDLPMVVAASDLSPRGSADAAHGVHPGSYGHSGGVLWLGESNAPIVGISRKQTTVSRSSTEAEIIALDFLTKQAIWFRKLLNEIGLLDGGPVLIEQDSQPAIALIKNGVTSKDSRGIRIPFDWITDVIEDGEVKLVEVRTNLIMADGLTKGLAPKVFLEWRRRILNLDAL